MTGKWCAESPCVRREMLVPITREYCALYGTRDPTLSSGKTGSVVPITGVSKRIDKSLGAGNAAGSLRRTPPCMI